MDDRSYLLKPEVSPYLIYQALKRYYGPPNDKNFDESKTQWSWLLQRNSVVLEIYDYKWGLSIAVHRAGSEEEGKRITDAFSALLEKTIEPKIKSLAGLIKGNKHKILDNPFVIYYSTAVELLDIAETLEKNPGELNEFELGYKQHLLYRSALLTFLSAFEGFLNLYYELYLKTELRTQRITEKIARDQIDIRIHMLPTYCDGFSLPIDPSDDRLRNFLRLVNFRNDYVHANIIPSLHQYLIRTDGHTFLIEPADIGVFPKSIEAVKLTDALRAREYIDGIIAMIIEKLKPKRRKLIKELFNQPAIEVEEKDGKLIVHS